MTSASESLRKMAKGVDDAVRAIAATYGPRGRTVMLERAGGLLSTKDGVAVAWELEPTDPLERLGVRVVQAACARLDKSCGDGTTTVAVLIQALLAEALRQLAGGVPAAGLSQGLQRVADSLRTSGVLELLRLDVEDEATLFHVAQVASNGDDEVAAAIVKLLDRVGTAGIVVVEEGRGRSIEVDFKRGLELERGWESSDFAGEGGAPRVLEIALVAVLDCELTKLSEVTSLVEEATQFPHPLVIVSRGCFGEALQTLVLNDRKLERPGGLFEVVAVRAPGRDDKVRGYLEDISALTGAEIVDPMVRPLSTLTADVLGSAQTVTVSGSSAILTAFPDRFAGIEARVRQLRLEEARAAHSHDIEVLRTRIARLSDGLGILRVGGASPTEIRERRGRIEDAFHAVKKAVEGGIVPGGGVAYFALSEALRQTSDGTPEDLALQAALEAPLTTLVRNSAVPAASIIREMRVRGAETEEGFPSWACGWDVHVDGFRDFREPLLCDPLEVVREVVDVAVSTVSMLVNVGAALTRAGRV